MKDGFQCADTGAREQKFKKIYLAEKCALEAIEAKFSEWKIWEILMRQLLIRKDGGGSLRFTAPSTIDEGVTHDEQTPAALS
ncbi:MAG TPA: hypothetical protein VH985_13320 [Candidatus Binatia bacterium]|jgi:hypothetical protein